jgi:hypothetical protein
MLGKVERKILMIDRNRNMETPILYTQAYKE